MRVERINVSLDIVLDLEKAEIVLDEGLLEELIEEEIEDTEKYIEKRFNSELKEELGFCTVENVKIKKNVEVQE